MPDTEMVKLSLPDGTTIWVEGWELETEGGPVREAADLESRAADAVETLTHTIRGYTQLVIGALRDASEAAMPDKATISFGVKIGGGVSAAIARASAEANVTVTAEWMLKPAEAKA